jgi:hypothetical protein
MGWSFRKSMKCGPLRINLSKSGVGYSIGGKGFRTGVNAKGRKYTSASIPGTGLRYQKTIGKKGERRFSRTATQAKGCGRAMLLVLCTIGGLVLGTLVLIERLAACDP